MSKSLTLKPRVSEKAYALSETKNTYTFEVPNNANKHTVKRAVQAQYEVTVTEVNITNIQGKVKRTIRKGGRSVSGKRSDVKKAYVTLKEGDNLPIFAALDDAVETTNDKEKK